MAELFGRLLWGNLMVGLLLRVADRPRARDHRRAHDASNPFLQLYRNP